MLRLIERVLCSPCESLFRGTEQSKAPNPFFPHHNSFASFSEALQQGCLICMSIWARLSQECRSYIIEKRGEYVLSRFNRYFGGIGRLDFNKGYYVVIDVCPVFEVGAAASTRFIFALEPFDNVEEILISGASPQNVSTRDMLEPRALFWYEWCRKKHTKCSTHERPPSYLGPTRLVEIDTSTWTSWRLIDNAPVTLPNAPYASLSHCWGPNPLLTLTSSTIAEMKQGMPVNSMPKTFQDAIEVAKHLSIQYIWIDSLCILQDSAPDWQYESARMKDVYSHAEVNIAATAAAQGSDGCFFNKTAAPMGCWKVNVEWAGGREYVAIDLNDLKAQLFDAPLNQRAWVVQERILSPRILHLGSHQLFWQCKESFTCEDWPMGIPKSLSYSLGAHWSIIEKVLRGLHSVELKGALGDHKFSSFDLRYSAGHGKIYFFWTHLVELYTKCHLTKGDDKLIALSGIAQLFNEILEDDEYLAGLWRKDLAYELLWSVEASGLRVLSRAPSWSWASMDGVIEERGRQYAAKNDAFLARIVDAKTVLRTGNPTGQVNGGFLTVTGFLVQGVYKHTETNKGQLIVFNSVGTAKKVEIHCTSDEENGLNGPLWYIPVREQFYQELMVQGLILQKSDCSGRFSRVGYWQCFEKENEDNAFECFGLGCQSGRTLGQFRLDAILDTITIQ